MSGSHRIEKFVYIKYVSGDMMTNTSLRERFNIDKKNYAMVSRLIRQAQDQGVIKLYDPSSKSKKHAKYLPFWA